MTVIKPSATGRHIPNVGNDLFRRLFWTLVELGAGGIGAFIAEEQINTSGETTALIFTVVTSAAVLLKGYASARLSDNGVT